MAVFGVRFWRMTLAKVRVCGKIEDCVGLVEDCVMLVWLVRFTDGEDA